MTEKKQGLHAALERGIAAVEKKIESVAAGFEASVDGPRFAVGDRVRSRVDYRRGQEGVITEADPEDGYVVAIESSFNGVPGVVDCHFHVGDVERVMSAALPRTGGES